MKIVIFILAFFLTIIGCKSINSKAIDKQPEYFYVQYNIECCTELYLDTVNVVYNINIKDSIYTLCYLYSSNNIADTITYRLKESDKFEPEYFLNGKKDNNDSFFYVLNKNYKVKGIEFKVYKYANNPFVIDGCTTHFWVPKIGVLITRSTTWRNFQKLQTNNDSINEYINIIDLSGC